MFRQGKFIVAVIVVGAIILSIGAILFRIQQSRRSMMYLGGETAQIIQQAPQVELLELGPPLADAAGPPSPNNLIIEEKAYPILRRIDISKLPGLTHARQALLADSGYDWSTPDVKADHWTQAWQFTNEGGRSKTIALSLDEGRLFLVGHRVSVSIAPLSEKLKALIYSDPTLRSELESAKPSSAPEAPAESTQTPSETP